MIAQLPAHHEPIEGAALRRALDLILARPVTDLPTPDETQILEQRKAAGRVAAQNATRKFQARKAASRPAFDRQAVGDDLARGMTVREVTVKHGISETTVKKILKERGIKRGPRGSAPRFDHEQALRDLDSGLTTREVAALHKVHPQTVNRVRRERRAQG